MSDLTVARLINYSMVAGAAAAGLAVAAVISGRLAWAVVALAPALVGLGCLAAVLVGRPGRKADRS